MTRDYAKLRTAKTSRRYGLREQRSQTPGWLWLLAGLLLGALMVSFYWFMEQKNKHRLAPTISANTKEVSKQTTKKLPIEKPRFDFYTLLPNMDLGTSGSESMAPPTPPAPAQLPVFLVQAGSFQEYAQADTLKAQLTLLGFEVAKIQETEIKPGDKRFRVLLGPFQAEKEARKFQEHLKMQAMLPSVIIRQ